MVRSAVIVDWMLRVWSPYNFESVPMALRRICLEDTSAGVGVAALTKSWLPTASDIVKTREETVAPSRRFLLRYSLAHIGYCVGEHIPFTAGLGNQLGKVP